MPHKCKFLLSVLQPRNKITHPLGYINASAQLIYICGHWVKVYRVARIRISSPKWPTKLLNGDSHAPCTSRLYSLFVWVFIVVYVCLKDFNPDNVIQDKHHCEEFTSVIKLCEVVNLFCNDDLGDYIYGAYTTRPWIPETINEKENNQVQENLSIIFSFGTDIKLLTVGFLYWSLATPVFQHHESHTWRLLWKLIYPTTPRHHHRKHIMELSKPHE